MSKHTLVINPGSSSVKFGLFSENGDAVIEICRGAIEGIGSKPLFSIDGRILSNTDIKKLKGNPPTDLSNIEAAYGLIINWLNATAKFNQIDAVCYRVVHGGSFYKAPVIIDEKVFNKLVSLIPLAPLHQPIAIQAIKLFKQQFLQSKHIACFDTAFHSSMPKVAQTFALPSGFFKQGIKRYGFHGLSYEFISRKLTQLNQNKIPQKIVIAHLGSGASLCALKNGKSIATSMSFSPLDGLPMATRTGAIDANVVLYMIDQLKLSTNEISEVFNRQSGLLGLSGLSGDVQVLMQSNDAKARFAIDYFVYRICRELGAMVATLQGLDALIFTGGIGANNPLIRERICKQLAWLNISINSAANQSKQTVINDESSLIAVYSLKTDEELMMAILASSTKN